MTQSGIEPATFRLVAQSHKPTVPPRAPYNIKMCVIMTISLHVTSFLTQETSGSGVINYYTLDADASSLYSTFSIHRPVFLPLNFIPDRSVSVFAYRGTALPSTIHHLAAFAKLDRTAAMRKPSEHREQMR